jgi:hypothetical protein
MDGQYSLIKISEPDDANCRNTAVDVPIPPRPTPPKDTSQPIRWIHRFDPEPYCNVLLHRCPEHHAMDTKGSQNLGSARNPGRRRRPDRGTRIEETALTRRFLGLAYVFAGIVNMITIIGVPDDLAPKHANGYRRTSTGTKRTTGCDEQHAPAG